MLVLALDTTTREGSLALARDGRVFDCWSGDASLTHARRLPGDILHGLSRNGLALADVTLFAVAAGPGSFTGLRIGIATIQGLAFAHRRPVVGVSALDALAYAARPVSGGGRIGVWMDAQRQEVFACLYDPSAAGPPEPVPGEASRPGATVEGEGTAGGLGELWIVAGPEVGFPAEILSDRRWQDAARTAWVGDGALRYRGVIEEAAAGESARLIEPIPPLAPSICLIAARRAELGLATAPHAIRPVYIRRPDAELARDRRRQAVEGARKGGE